jgi:hypothetical protein
MDYFEMIRGSWRGEPVRKNILIESCALGVWTSEDMLNEVLITS